MKLRPMEPLCLKRSPLKFASKLVFFSALALIGFPLLSIYHGRTALLLRDSPPSFPSSSFLTRSLPSFSLPRLSRESVCELSLRAEAAEGCDMFSGEWVPSPEGPYYTNDTCWYVQEHQNCMKNGRNDTGYLKWRWKPNACEIPLFNPNEFLKIMKDRSLAFVGDSVARNHMQSLLCLLSPVAKPLDVSRSRDDNYKKWYYSDYNFTMQIFWSPYLVRTRKPRPEDRHHSDFVNLYLDEFDESWTSKIHNFHYVIISAGHWFFRPLMFYEEGQFIGCLYCEDIGVKRFDKFFGYKKAFHTAFKAINSLRNYNGTTFLRTFAPSHFENGEWNTGGTCRRLTPYRNNETQLTEDHSMFYSIQMEEFNAAKNEWAAKGRKLKLIDTTKLMVLRPDGHPSIFGRMQHLNLTIYNDCVHWCLPGPVDAWNEILLHMMKMEVAQSCRDGVAKVR